VFTARAVSSSAVLLTPVVAIAWAALGRPGLPPRGLGLALLSGALEVAYFVFLSWAYARGELSVVYPIARGTAPVLATLIGLLLLALARVGGRALLMTSEWARAASVGLLITLAYLLVLLAYRLAPLSIVAPLRESAVVLVAGWGVFRLRERQGARLKLAGAAAILAGVALIALG